MMSVIQRVKQARVEVGGRITGQIDQGLLALVCAERGDTEAEADKLLAKMLKLRIFSDEAGKMNRSVQDVAGGLLVVSQFTLAAVTSGGNRPSFTNAAAPDEGRRLDGLAVDGCTGGSGSGCAYLRAGCATGLAVLARTDGSGAGCAAASED